MRHCGGAVVRVSETGTVEPLPALQRPHNVWGLAFSPAGDQLAVTSWTNPGALLRVWNWQGGRPGEQVREEVWAGGDCAPPCAFAPEGTGLAWSPGNFRSANVLHLLGPTGWSVEGAHAHVIRSLTFLPNGRGLLSASYDDTVVLRDARTGQPVTTPLRFTSNANTVAVHPQLPLVAVGTNEKVLHLYRVTDALALHPVGTLPFENWVRAVAFATDGRHALVVTGAWETCTLHVLSVDAEESG